MSTIEELAWDLCTGCAACAQSCPRAVIAMQSDAEGFLHPVIQKTACVDCGVCVGVCPVLSPSGERPAPLAYAARAQDEELREKSSSGGVFSLLAAGVLERGGVVFGAAFNDEFDVVHTAVHSTEELAKLRGSKYVQSRIGDAYSQARVYLEEGKTVLFSGTPCQIEGLLAYLRRPYERLITQDIICHGVPSPLVWQNYVKEQERTYGAPLRMVNFRHKSPDWRRYSLQMGFDNDQHYVASRADDPYMRSFLKDLTLRPSCYQCVFKKLGRVSDITLADFWGVQDCVPHMDDGRGTSLVICHSEKGRALLDNLLPSLICEPTDLQAAIVHNGAMMQSVPRPALRDAFMRDIVTMPLGRAVRQYCPKPTLWSRIAGKCKRILRGR